MPEELQISQLREEDLAEALRLSTEAGWNQTLEDWHRVLALTRRRGGFAGRQGGQLVATGTLVEHGRGGWVGMILVDEQYRRRGLGTAMLDRTIAAADDAGLSWIGLNATTMGRPLYLKRGFADVGHKDRWQLTKPAGQLQTRGMRKLELCDAIQQLDFRATGIDRMSMLKLMCENPHAEGYVCRNDGELGFGCSRPGRIGSYIGPVIAESSEIAAAIVSKLLERLAPAAGRRVFIDVPRGSAIEPWLNAEGFEVVRSWTRMIRGPIEIADRHMVFAIAGPELG